MKLSTLYVIAKYIIRLIGEIDNSQQYYVAAEKV